jgi:hypothetical protein
VVSPESLGCRERSVSAVQHGFARTSIMRSIGPRRRPAAFVLRAAPLPRRWPKKRVEYARPFRYTHPRMVNGRTWDRSAPRCGCAPLASAKRNPPRLP